MDKIAKTTLSIMFIVLCGLISLALMEEERERKIEEIEKMELQNMEMIEYSDDM